MPDSNRLYFGDCLDVMREDIPAESVDLIYLDPPFNSKRLYNAFIGGAQWVAFDDTWRWHEAGDDFRFERWAASLVDGMEANVRQRGDKGIDGYGRIPIRKGQFIDIVSQVKGGGTSPGDVQAFNGARQQAGADLGIFTCFDERVTPRMKDVAVSAGRFMETPIIQLYTVEDYFEGRIPAMPKVA